MAYIILIDFSGCYAQKILSTAEMTSPDNYVIHTRLAAYATNNNTISDGILSGMLDFNTRNLPDSKYLHLYLISDSSFVIKNDHFTLPVSSIKEIKQRVRDQKKTRTLSTVLIVVASIGFIAAVTVAVVGLVQLSKTPVPDPDKVCTDLEEMELCSDGSPD